MVFKRTLRALSNRLLLGFNALGFSRECPFCHWTGFRFLPYGVNAAKRLDALCPGCGSLERHRLAYILLKGKLPRLNRCLHVAPEQVIEQWLRSISLDYLSIDLGGAAMQKMDITQLSLPSNFFSLVYCSHVLEHVPADAQAISELYRVLEIGGLAIIQVPIRDGPTYEDVSLTTDEDRLKAFFQVDHVRLYGIDLVQRLQSAGFSVEVYRPHSLSHRLIHRYRLTFFLTNELFVAKKWPH